MDKTETLSMRVTPEVKRMLQLAAAREQRSQTNLLEKLLADYCLAAGLVTEGQARRSAS